MEPTIPGSDPGSDSSQTSPPRSSTGLEANIAGLLCYLLGLLTGILFLVIERESPFVRFHAVQSTVTFGAILVIQMFCGFIPLIGHFIGMLLGPVALVLWIVLMLKAYHGELFKLPAVGDIAEQHAEIP